jgi:hypothetical protein
MVTDKEIFNLVDASPSLSDGSKIAYKKQLQSLKKALDDDISKIILHPLGVELLDTAFATKIAYTNAVNSLFKRDKEFSNEVGADTGLLDYVGEDIRKKWADLLKQLHAQRETLVDMNVRSQREKENWVSTKEWKEMDETLGMNERGSQAQLLVAFHTQIPPPRGGDLAQVRICNDEKECPEGNIIIVTGSNPRLIIRDHKTRRKYGAIVVKLPSSLEQDVIVSLEAQPREYLFVNSHNEMYPTRDAFMTWKSNTFKRLFKRDVTTNIARREYATTEDMNAPLHQLKRSAEAMGHSIETHHAYRVVKPKQGVQEGEDDVPTEGPTQRQRRDGEVEGGGFFSDVKKFFGLAGTETGIQTAIDPRDLQKMCEQAYARFNGRAPLNVGKWDLIRQTDEDLLYRFGDTFVVAVRGTQGAPNGPDWTANQTIPFNGLINTQRCAIDLATVTGWKREFPMGTWYATGHSLGGAICDELLRAGLVTEAYTFNPAVQTKDFNGKLKNRRVYARGDPLYQLFGRFTVGAILQPAGSLAKELLTRVSPSYFAANALDQHNLSAFDSSTLQGGMQAAIDTAARNEPLTPSDCVRQSLRALSTYYPRFNVVLTTMDFPPIPNTDNLSNAVVQAFLLKGYGFPEYDFETLKRIKLYRRSDEVFQKLSLCQEHGGGGFFMYRKFGTKGVSPGHVCMYVKDPVSGLLTFFNPFQSNEVQTLPDLLRRVWPVDMREHTPEDGISFILEHYRPYEGPMPILIGIINIPIPVEAGIAPLEPHHQKLVKRMFPELEL